uniref:Uncharacterized protein n=1 Tax=Setaria italica TaxID=4555 RepID=K3Y3Y1_SETIT
MHDAYRSPYSCMTPIRPSVTHVQLRVDTGGRKSRRGLYVGRSCP